LEKDVWILKKRWEKEREKKERNGRGGKRIGEKSSVENRREREGSGGKGRKIDRCNQL